MLKKCTSWILLCALFVSCLLCLPLSAEPANDAAAVTQGYHGRYPDADGSTVYFKFNASKDGNQRDLALEHVPQGATVTLIADAVLDFELYLNGNYTIEGAGHTLNGGLRSDSGSANVTVKNLNFHLALGTKDSGAVSAYLLQLNAGNYCTFESCTFTVTGTPAYALIIPRGELTMQNCDLTYSSEGDKPVFLPETDNQATLISTSFDLSGAANASIGLAAGTADRYYNTFAKALNAAAEGATVTLLDDISVTGTTDDKRVILSGKQVKLNGNGKTIFGNTASYLIRFDSSCEVSNLTVFQTGAAAAVQINAGAAVTVEKSVFQCTSATPYGTVIVNGRLILNTGASVVSEGDASDGTQSVGVRMNTAGSELTVNNGAVITTVGNTVKANCTNSSKITVNGGIITTARHMWEAAGTNRCTLIINGGTFVSSHAADALICVFGSKDQTVELNGGTFTAPKIMDTENALTSLSGTVTFNGNVLFRAPEAGDITNPAVDLRLPEGNRATLANSGIRFESRIEKEWLNGITASGVTVATGTLIAAKSTADEAGAFTREALDAAGKRYLIIENDGWYQDGTAEDSFYRYYGTMVNLRESSLTGEIAGTAYVTVTVPGLGSFTYYGTQQSGVVRTLAAGLAGQDTAQTEVLNFFQGIAD